MMRSFTHQIAADVAFELSAASRAQAVPQRAFAHLERAHILGQASTRHHVRVHLRMLRWAWQQRNLRESVGQVLRIVGAATKTALGWVPSGNPGGANVNPFKSYPVAPDLQAKIWAAQSRAGIAS